MKFYYPKDKNGNRIGFKTPESQVYDTNGRSLTDKLTELNSNIGGLTSHPNTKASASVYGHVKLSDTYSSSVSGGNASGGLGASQNALYNAYNTLNNKLDSKLEIIFHNNGTSANDIYQTGIHKCSQWKDYPSDAPDAQGILICYNYAGTNTNGWYRQLFITPHNDTTWVRGKTGGGDYSSWKKQAFSDVANVKNWTVILSQKESGDYEVQNMSGYKEILITWGYVYDISKSIIIPYNVFQTLTGGSGAKCFIDYPNAYILYKSDTLIGLENNNTDNLIRVFAR